jgi:hypothetical protein
VIGYKADVGGSGRSAAWLARLLGVQEVVGSNPAGPTILQKKPFGETVEGLSRFQFKSCGVQFGLIN